jgi:ankyrin repeat protein
MSSGKLLYDAICKQQRDEAMRLIREGCDVAYRSPDDVDAGFHVIHLAAYWGHAQIVRELLARGVDAMARDVHGCTPLHIACCEQFRGVAEVVKVLLDAGAMVDARTERGVTPLMLAAGHGFADANYAIMLELLRRGADPNAQDSEFGFVALHEASGVRTIRALLEAGADPTITSRAGQRPDESQAEHGNKREAKYLRRIIDADRRGGHGRAGSARQP